MTTRKSYLLPSLSPICSFAAIFAFTASQTYAANGTWDGDGKNYSWGGFANWKPNGAPADGAGYTAYFTYELKNNDAIKINTSKTIGNITFTDTTSSNDLTLEMYLDKQNRKCILTLDNKGLPPVINVTQADRTLSITTQIAGQAGLTKAGLGSLILFDQNTYSGPTIVKAGTLKVVAGGSCVKSPLVVMNAGSTHNVFVADNTKSWTYASLKTKSPVVLEFEFDTTPSETVAPLFFQGSATFTDTPRVVIKGKVKTGTFPLMTWDNKVGIPPTSVKVPDGFTGTLKVTDYALFVVLAPTAVSK